MKGLLLVLFALLVTASATQAATCTIGTTSLAFGDYSPLSGTHLDSTATVQVQCSTLIALFFSFRIELSIGSAPTYFPRRMVSGANTLNYNIYTDSLRSLVFGTGTGGTFRINFGELISIGTTTRNYTVYGRIPNQPAAKPGNYGDSVLVTVYF